MSVWDECAHLENEAADEADEDEEATGIGDEVVVQLFVRANLQER